MFYAEYWDDIDYEYVSVCFNEEETCRDWCFENQVASYEDEDGREHFI